MNIFWLILVFLLGLVLFGTGATTSGPSGSTNMVEIDGNPGVILHASTYHPDAEDWLPTISDLQAAEDAVRSEPAGDREPQLVGFRQYVGIVEDGERKIIVNSMCTEAERWTEQYIKVADGGPCYWTALYNVDTGELEYLVVNGEA